MQLTSYTDYSLRALLYLGRHQEKLITVTEISDYYGVSRHHMVKVIHNLALLGYVKTIRGKSGGVRLEREPQDINIAEIVSLTEPHMNLQECFTKKTNSCLLIDTCKLMGVLYQARAAFMDVLSANTLADMLEK